MAKTRSIDQALIEEIKADAQQARIWGLVFVLSGILIQIMHFFALPIGGFRAMLVVSGVILVGSGFLFYAGSTSVPTNRAEIVLRLQKVMIDQKPERRLWAAQRLIGYAKEANFTKNQILSLATHAKKVAQNPPVKSLLQLYVRVDHIIFLREMAVAINMDKHIRKEFVAIIRPLNKLKGLPDDAYEVLADAIAYHPSKLPVQAYSDYLKIKEDDKED